MSTGLVLDIDGTVVPRSAHSPFGDLVEVGHGIRATLVSRQLCGRLDRIGSSPSVHPAWLTSTPPDQRRQLDQPFPGRAWSQVPPASGSHRSMWPKWVALNSWLDNHQGVTRLAWIDDDLGPWTAVPQNTPEQVGNYRSGLARRLDDVLLIAPPPDYGITPAQLRLLTDWLTPD